MMPEDEDRSEDRDTEKEAGDKQYPSLDVAEAKIKQALLKYQVRIQRVTPREEDTEEKVRLQFSLPNLKG